MFNYRKFEDIKLIKDFNEVIDYGWTHFHEVCYNNYNLEMIKYCVEHCADLNIKNDYDSTPFHWICYNQTTKEVLEYCLENGADLTIENIDGNTPFSFICEENKNLIPICKPYMNEYDFIKTLKECEINWKEYV